MNPQPLEKDIATYLNDHESSTGIQISLGQGSEYIDLAAYADFQVRSDGCATPRYFSIITAAYARDAVSRSHDQKWAKLLDGHFVTGGPLIVVRSITGESVVRGILRYLLLEKSRAET